MGDWVPPSEAEMKAIEARRERNNEISRLMASYMLKGYRMLDSVCPLCQTVLLREPNGQDYCVACKELGSALGNNNSPINIKSSIEEQGESLDRDSSEDAIGDNNIDANGAEKESYCVTHPSLVSNPADGETSRDFRRGVAYPDSELPILNAYLRLKTKIDKLSQNLHQCNDMRECKEICETIKTCAETAFSIKKLL